MVVQVSESARDTRAKFQLRNPAAVQRFLQSLTSIATGVEGGDAGTNATAAAVSAVDAVAGAGAGAGAGACHNGGVEGAVAAPSAT